MQNGRFLCKSVLLSKKVHIKFLCVKTISDKAVRYSLASIHAKWLLGNVRPRLYRNLAETD